MEQSLFCHENELFPNNEFVKKQSFKAFDTGAKSALLYVVCLIQTAAKGLMRGKSAHFQTQTEDCFECLGCLSPLRSAL